MYLFRGADMLVLPHSSASSAFRKPVKPIDGAAVVLADAGAGVSRKNQLGNSTPRAGGKNAVPAGSRFVVSVESGSVQIVGCELDNRACVRDTKAKKRRLFD